MPFYLVFRGEIAFFFLRITFIYARKKRQKMFKPLYIYTEYVGTRRVK